MAKSFEEVKASAANLQSAYGERDTIFDEVEKIFLMDDAELPSKSWIKESKSPAGRNKLLGAVRLLTAADPVWSVPRDKNSDNIEQKDASNLEKAASMMWIASGRIKKTPVHYTTALSGLLYSQADIVVQCVDELIKAAGSNKALKKRLERVKKKTPVLFEALNPKICYPLFDAYGLAAHYSVREMAVVDVRARWGDVLADNNLTDLVNYHEYWDDEKHVVWVDGQDDALLDEEHDLPMIPIASARMEGSDLFEKEFQFQPFLYTMYKGETYKRASLLQTIMFTNLFTIGSNPQIVHKKAPGSADAEIDYDVPGGKWEIDAGDSLEQFKLQAVTGDMQVMYDLIQNQIETSTLYSQTLGEPLGSNAPYSMVHLLSQAGRLPLVPYQRMLSNLASDAMQIAFELLRANGSKFVVGGDKQGVEIDLNDFEDIEIQGNLDISMPQDRTQNAKTAIELANSRMISKERAREDYLQIGQSDDEEQVIMSESMTDVYIQSQIEKYRMMQQIQTQQDIQRQMQGAPQGMGQPGMKPPQGGMPPQMPPQMMQGQMLQGMPPQGMPPEMLQQGAAQAGLPLTEALPPQGQPNPEEMGPPDMQMPGGV